MSEANTAVSRVGSERSSLGGVKDHEQSEYRSNLERQEFVVRNGAKRNGGRQSLSGSEDKISDSKGAELAERKEND